MPRNEKPKKPGKILSFVGLQPFFLFIRFPESCEAVVMTKKFINLLLILLAIQLLFTGLYAQDEQKAELVVQFGHSSVVGCVAFSPDERAIVTGDGNNNVLILWDVKTGLELHRFTDFTGGCVGVTFSHDGKYFAAITKDFLLHKWNVVTGQKEWEVDCSDWGIPKGLISFTADDKSIVTAGYYSGSSKRLKSLKQNSIVPDSSNTADGIVSGNLIHLRDAFSGKMLKLKSADLQAFSSDRQYAFIQKSFSRTKRKSPNAFSIWDLSNWSESSRLVVDEQKTDIISAAFSKDGNKLFAVIQDFDAKRSLYDFAEKRSLKVWSVTTGKLLKTDSIKILVNIASILPEKNTLMFECHNSKEKTYLKNLCLFNFETKKKTELQMPIVLDYNNDFTAYTVSSSGRLIAVGTGNSTTSVFDLSENKEISWLAARAPFIVEVSTDRKSILVKYENNSQMRWDLENGNPILEQKGTERSIVGFSQVSGQGNNKFPSSSS